MSEKEWLALAAHLARCAPDEVLAFRVRDDGSMVVVIQPGPKYVYTPEQVEAAKAEMRAKPPAAPELPLPVPELPPERQPKDEPPPAEPPPTRARRRNF